MAALETIASLAAVVSALTDVYTVGRDTYQNYLARRRREMTPSTLSQQVIVFFGTYTDEEVEAIERRLRACTERFIAEGVGGARKTCICSVLQDVQAGNNGLPDGKWKELAEALGCF